MNLDQAYQDGYANGLRRGKAMNRHMVERAIRDCEEMGWKILRSYFVGELDGMEKALSEDVK
mgnify:CR=1 FL=1